MELKGIDRNTSFFRDALYLKDVYEAERSQNPEHVFHENMGKLKAVKGENPWRVVVLKAAQMQTIPFWRICLSVSLLNSKVLLNNNEWLSKVIYSYNSVFGI